MATHRVYGSTHVGGQPVSRRVDIVSAADWPAGGLVVAVLGSTVSDAGGEWSVELDSDDLVYAMAPPIAPYPPLVLGPIKPVPIDP